MILRYDDGTHWLQAESGRETRHNGISVKPVAISSNLKIDEQHDGAVTERERDEHNATVDGMEAALMATLSRSHDLWEQERFNNVCRTLIDALTNNIDE